MSTSRAPSRRALLASLALALCSACGLLNAAESCGVCVDGTCCAVARCSCASDVDACTCDDDTGCACELADGCRCAGGDCSCTQGTCRTDASDTVVSSADRALDAHGPGAVCDPIGCRCESEECTLTVPSGTIECHGPSCAGCSSDGVGGCGCIGSECTCVDDGCHCPEAAADCLIGSLAPDGCASGLLQCDGSDCACESSTHARCSGPGCIISALTGDVGPYCQGSGCDCQLDQPIACTCTGIDCSCLDGAHCQS